MNCSLSSLLNLECVSWEIASYLEFSLNICADPVLLHLYSLRDQLILSGLFQFLHQYDLFFVEWAQRGIYTEIIMKLILEDTEGSVVLREEARQLEGDIWGAMRSLHSVTICDWSFQG